MGRSIWFLGLSSICLDCIATNIRWFICLGYKDCNKGVVQEAHDRSWWGMVAIDFDGFLKIGNVAHVMMETLCMQISNEMHFHVQIHNKHVLPRSETSMLPYKLILFVEHRWVLIFMRETFKYSVMFLGSCLIIWSRRWCLVHYGEWGKSHAFELWN